MRRIIIIPGNDYRYISRCVLLPCCGLASSVELDVLSELLSIAGAAFPQGLSVGHYVTQMSADKVYAIREKFCRKVEISADRQDSRLTTHYSLFIACVKKVKHTNNNY